MKREFDRYIVIKKSDLQYALGHGSLIGADIDTLNCILEVLNLERHRRGKSDLQTVVVEHDWPEYERVWNMIEARVDNHIGEDIDSLRRKAAAFDMITELMGYVQNGTDGIITLFQDDATLTYWVTHRTAGKKEHDWQEHAASLEQAIRNAFDKHGDN